MFRKTVLISLLICIPMAFLFAGGGSQSRSPVQTSGPVKLSVAIMEDIRIADYKTNYMTRVLERDADVNLEFVLYPSVDYISKLNLMVMAGGSELQDVIIASPGDAMVYQWGLEKAIIPLTKYYKDPNLSPNIHEAIKRTGVDFPPMVTSPDGEIYGVPEFNMSSGNEYAFKMWYYDPWLKQLGLKIPETTEEFREVLRTVVTRDPNGNGRADEIGISGLPPLGDWFGFLMNAFVYAGDTNQLVVENGKLGAAYTTPQWREGLKYIRSLFQEGLIPMENLTQDRTQVNTILNSSDVRAFSFIYASVSQINTDNPAGDEYICAPPLRGPAGVQYATYTPSVPNISYMVSSRCMNPDAAFRLGDVMASREIGIIQRWGEEGVNWDYPENVKNIQDYMPAQTDGPITMVPYNDASFWGGSAVGNGSWRQKGPLIREYNISDSRGTLRGAPVIRTRHNNEAIILYQSSNWAPKEVIPKLIYTVEENNTIQDIRISLNNYVMEMTSAFLAGNRDIDASWEAYLAELNSIGLARFISVNQTVYDRMYK